MRVYRFREDAVVCLLVTLLIAWGIGKLTEQAAASAYEGYLRNHSVADGEVGGSAGEEVFRIQSAEDILSHERFTLESDMKELYAYGNGYYDGLWLRMLKLPSGEYVAAVVNIDYIQFVEDGIGGILPSGDCILPVGQAVYADLTEDADFLERIQKEHPLSRTDFYIDMTGRGQVMEEEEYVRPKVSAAHIVTAIVCFPFLHWIGSRVGLFPYIFTPRRIRNRKSEWE